MSAGRAPRLFQRSSLRALSGFFNNASLQAGAEQGRPQIKAHLPSVNYFAAGVRASHLTKDQEYCPSVGTDVGSQGLHGSKDESLAGGPSPTKEPPVQGEKPGLGDKQDPSPRHDLAMVFTCSVCETRSAKTMNRATYEKGVVIVRCPGCKNLHLISDRLGWFGEPGSVEDFLAQKGLDVRTGNDDTYQLTLEDLTGWTPKARNSE
eukprot:TRINITY_DN5355_c0_g1_i1.p1 TRINITY_DN5355_c0_g1~~TRINITY_DN5355_c0_g1_i1.p1  ORF type:complete len:206 (+),score=14.10 TRINITY_DN5355_c0_g1_i1:98-715(+)